MKWSERIKEIDRRGIKTIDIQIERSIKPATDIRSLYKLYIFLKNKT
jgi:hypothetical protein